jgi:phosphatidylethanolamine-binding protein (PEBP) family uncharacterized protein
MSGGSGSAGASGSGAGAAGAAGATGGTFTLTMPDFVNMPGCAEDMATSCAVLPTMMASYMSGPNVSPELNWTGTPAGTMSIAIVLRDLTRPNAHWILWNIMGNATKLDADVPKTSNMPDRPAGTQQANLATGDGYLGPGSACNVYEFEIYALSVMPFSPTNVTDANGVVTQLEALGSQILGTATLRGRQNYMNMCN